MPSIQDAIESRNRLSSYIPVPSAPPVLALLPSEVAPATNLRFILPPFNSDPDTVRQFEVHSTGPKNRIWPLPQAPASSNKTVTTGGSTSTSSSSSSSSSSVTLTAKSITFSTGTLPAESEVQTSVQMAESFQLLSISVNGPCEVRLYGTKIAQSHDASRVTGDPVPPEISANVITCITFDTSPYSWGWQNRIGANQDNPQSTAIYVTVINTDPLLADSLTVTISYLPLESA